MNTCNIWISPKTTASCCSVAIYSNFLSIPPICHASSCHWTFTHVYLPEFVPHFAQLTSNLSSDHTSSIISSKHPFLSLLTRLHPLTESVIVLWITPSGYSLEVHFCLSLCGYLNYVSFGALLFPTPNTVLCDG